MAIFGLVFVLGGHAVWAGLGVVVDFKRLRGEFGRDDTRRYGDDAIAQYHDDGGDELPQRTGRRNVAITHCG